MTTIQATGTLLKASRDERTLTYLLLPYGEPGRTNVGTVTASKGSVTLPEDASSLRLNIEHDRRRPVGRGVSVEEADAGLVATFAVARTRTGDDLLEEAHEGLRAAVSVEIDDPVIRAGRLVGGALTGAGAVVEPAFPSALLVAADAGELPEDPQVEESTTENALDDPAEDNTEGEEPEPKENTVAESMTAATAPAGGLAASKTPKAEPTKGEVFNMLASAFQQGGQSRMLAALADIVPASTPGMEVPQFVGQLWSGKAYERRYIPLFARADLTSYNVKGWRWVTKPVVAAYDGSKAAVPSATVLTEAVDIAAQRIAGAHDIDRKYRDFGDEAFFAAYFAAMTESYAQVSDGIAIADAVTAAGAAVTVGDVPTGVSLAMTMIVDGALEVLDNTSTAPTFAVVNSALYRELLLTRSDDALAYLNAALGLEDGSLESFRIVPAPATIIPAGQVLVGVRDAMTVHELGGGAPIRVEAQNIANGGIDEGVFGYLATNVHDDGGLVLVDDGIA